MIEPLSPYHRTMIPKVRPVAPHSRNMKRLLDTLFVLIGSATLASAANLLAPGQSIIGVAATPGSATSAVAVSGGSGNAFPAAESPPNAIDNSTGTKYLNFAKINCGFIVTI